MLQATDLRIGNYVTTIYSDEWQAVNKLQCDIVKDGAFYQINSLLQEHIYPIPLTPELLEKCGFEKCKLPFTGGEGYCKSITSASITLSIGGNGEYSLHYPTLNTTIKYLHQLQNLFFALTGTELTINP